MTEILILGGSGFIGKNLILKCLEKKWNTTSISNKRKLDINHKLLKKYNIDLSNSKKIEKILKKNNFKLKKRVKFPFTTWEDRLYIRKD